MATKNQIPLSEVSRHLDAGIAAADVQRAAELERFQSVRRARGSGMQREQTRLASKLGADHPRVKELATRVAINRSMMQDLVAETERAKAGAPAADPNGWILHGFVRDKDRKGVPGLTVALYDQNGGRASQLGWACTESNGRFKIQASDSKSLGGGAVFIRVLDNQGAILYADKQPLAPQAGRVDYREITLSGQTQVCVPPPEPPGGSTSSGGT